MAEEETFKITDRRGRARLSPEPETPPTSPAAEEAPPQPPRRGPTTAQSQAREKPDLQSVFAMFASTALVALGAVPHPAGGEQSVDLERARDAIDLLLLLRDKTQGNRTEQETRILEQMLYDLQMRFVDVASRTRG